MPVTMNNRYPKDHDMTDREGRKEFVQESVYGRRSPRHDVGAYPDANDMATRINDLNERSAVEIAERMAKVAPGPEGSGRNSADQQKYKEGTYRLANGGSILCRGYERGADREFVFKSLPLEPELFVKASELMEGTIVVKVSEDEERLDPKPKTPHVERMNIELGDLSGRIRSLREFLYVTKPGSSFPPSHGLDSEEDRDLLVEQYRAMRHYQSILKARLERAS